MTSEIGDRTFLIAAILSMHHPRVTIFAAALSALGVMSFLSALLGNILPGLLPKQYTTAAAAVLFFVFGAKMLSEGLEMEGGEAGREKLQEELREVQKEVEEAEEEVTGRPGGLALDDMEEGRRASASSSGADEGLPQPVTGRARSKSLSKAKESAVASVRDGVKNLAQLLFSPIFIQAFILTFLAEWGDRSQITTIALGAAHVRPSFLFLTPSSSRNSEADSRRSRRTSGSSRSARRSGTRSARVEPSSAVGGSRSASRSSTVRPRPALEPLLEVQLTDFFALRAVTLGGAVLFLIFGVMYSYEAWYFVEEPLDALVS